MARPFRTGCSAILSHELEREGAALSILEADITTADYLGRLIDTILDTFVNIELKFIRNRQKAGIETAKAKGVYKGVP